MACKGLNFISPSFLYQLPLKKQQIWYIIKVSLWGCFNGLIWILQPGEQIVKMAPNHQEVPQNSRSDKDKVMIDNIIMSLSP